MAAVSGCGENLPPLIWGQTLGAQGMPGGNAVPLSSEIAYAPITPIFTGATDVNAALNIAETLLADAISVELPEGAMVVGAPTGPIALVPNLFVDCPQVVAVNPTANAVEFRPIGATQKHSYGGITQTGLSAAGFNDVIPVTAGVDEINCLPGSMGISPNGCPTFTAPMNGVYELTFNSHFETTFTTIPTAPSPFLVLSYVDMSSPSGTERGSQIKSVAVLPNVNYSVGGDASSASTTVKLNTGEQVVFCHFLGIFASDGVFSVVRNPGALKTTLVATLVA